MRLRKDDPIYYRNKIRDLIKQASEEGLGLDAYTANNKVRLAFEADNGDRAEVVICDAKE